MVGDGVGGRGFDVRRHGVFLNGSAPHRFQHTLARARELCDPVYASVRREVRPVVYQTRRHYYCSALVLQ